MQLISCHNGQLITTAAGGEAGAESRVVAAGGQNRSFVTGMSALDAIAPNGRLARGAVHELLADPAHGLPSFVAMVLAKSLVCDTGLQLVQGVRDQEVPFRFDDCLHGPEARVTPAGGAIVWCDPNRELYPPAVARFLPLEKLYLLHPQNFAEQSWAVAECLRCRGVAATIAAMPARLSRVQARRLQLAAEQGGGVGLVLRPLGPGSDVYAAATRWLVGPVPGERTVHKYRMQLIHGHGGRVGQAVILEHHRELPFVFDNDHILAAETDLVRATAELADRPVERQAPARALATATSDISHRRAS
jgi:hypothetical protein